MTRKEDASTHFLAATGSLHELWKGTSEESHASHLLTDQQSWQHALWSAFYFFKSIYRMRWITKYCRPNGITVIMLPFLLLNTDCCVLASAWASFCSIDARNISIKHLASYFHLRKLKASTELTNISFFMQRTQLQYSHLPQVHHQPVC